MEFKGTKGKWWSCCIKTTPHYVFSAGGDNTVICAFSKKQDMRDELPDEEFRANALLISKAPEMLNELENIVDCWDKNVFQELDIDAIRKLIKEATEL
jgi:hypothetical protein